MAEEKEGGSDFQNVWFVAGIIIVLALLWYYNDGPKRASLRGIFIQPPPPVGTGESYGPEIGQPAPWAPEQ
ncbi:hypothetical protein A2852_01510 [Candidatus Adlerbacteria bacterium RIFCSPHIGHO2_01_FULL_54_23]|uniref:Uncharacterized protein n=3 Tax=Candidatus Adleribacteriota TaxID=1752736 RepID=A0A1F4XZ17_9BACT|nr:MAG: hypothetical protein UY83_C0008G0027 [Candidatus Adlerbacteria bacterium GW2011_GWA1_54_10]KKW36275.1 MAG: hypothetical protein UY84_C0001G0163 [Candidatus Adlerbacteria bacterium GW2011_GWA2_54_12]KKW37805.1 MAG: hypothetical protein UY86_C0003G0027 [Candidatus Adlerbacteria bacterium GW2011_GWB1_54_7]OGC78806.1 MAG: hypothetical protein A2852_01510 [Candidatus Adlerbacteria bacterium RIFCSPHIGHO2_01_FULL_54_23]OGC86881.1 MAG: hypothetical protein A3B33_00855 [Candidatus Adlerbacteria 